MAFSVKEIYFTLQGEGAHSGRAAVFLRFAGCNLWSGREEHRAEAICRFCDTDFVHTDGPGGGKFEDAAELAAAVRSFWPETEASAAPYVVCTGGEPLLQLDESLVNALHDQSFKIGVESNGTIAAPAGIDWICVSPKGAAPVVQLSGNELKLVYPQDEPEAHPAKFVAMDFDHFFLQPLHDEDLESNTRAAIEYCLAHPHWRLSLQTHKLLGID